jgi:uncharacterized protein involved in outer membrane biogenesis
MRKFAIIIVVVALVIVAGAAVFVASFDMNRYRGTIQSQLQQYLGRPVQLGDMHLKLFPPSISVQNLAIADDPRFNPDAPSVKAGELDVSVKLLPLLHKQIEIRSLVLERPTINLIKDRAGQWNFASIGHPAQTSALPTQQSSPEVGSGRSTNPPPNPAQPQLPSSNTSAQSASQPSHQGFALSDLTIKDGQISLLDQTQSETPTLYDHIDVTLTDFSPQSAFTVDATVHVAGSGEHDMTLQGKGGPIASDLLKTPFRGTLELKQVGLSDFTKFLNSPAANGTDGVMSGETEIDNDSGRLTAEGETDVQSAKVRGMELGYPISAKYDLIEDLSGGLITIRNLDVKLGSTPLDLTGTMQTNSKPAQINMNLRVDRVSIAEAAKLAAASGTALSPGTIVSGTVSADIHAGGAADKPALSGTLTAANIQMSGREIAQPVQIQSVNFNMTPTQIQSNPFNIVSGGTTVNTQVTLRNYAAPSPVIDATMRAPNAQLPAVLAMAKAYGVTSLDKFSGQGTLNLDMHADGPLKSVSAGEIEKAVNGTINVNFANVRYSGANMGSQFAAIGKFLLPAATSQSTSGVTNISKMTGNIVVKNGIAQTNDLQAQLDIGNVGIAGTANIANEALNLRATAVISQAISQRVGGQSIGGFMQTALANKQGELVIPALITGTFSSPRFQPDVQQMAQMKLKGLIPNINNPSSVTGTLQNLLGGPKPPAQTPQQPGQQQQPASAVQQVLGGLLGNKKQSNPPK